LSLCSKPAQGGGRRSWKKSGEQCVNSAKLLGIRGAGKKNVVQYAPPLREFKVHRKTVKEQDLVQFRVCTKEQMVKGERSGG